MLHFGTIYFLPCELAVFQKPMLGDHWYDRLSSLLKSSVSAGGTRIVAWGLETRLQQTDAGLSSSLNLSLGKQPLSRSFGHRKLCFQPSHNLWTENRASEQILGPSPVLPNLNLRLEMIYLGSVMDCILFLTLSIVGRQKVYLTKRMQNWIGTDLNKNVHHRFHKA